MFEFRCDFRRIWSITSINVVLVFKDVSIFLTTEDPKTVDPKNSTSGKMSLHSKSNFDDSYISAVVVPIGIVVVLVAVIVICVVVHKSKKKKSIK